MCSLLTPSSFARRLALALVLPLAGCIIDGVPLPDARDGNESNAADSAETTAELRGAYATRASYTTVVFALPGTVDPDALISVTSGAVQSSTVAADDGSFNVTLGGALGNSLGVRITVNGSIVAQANLTTPTVNQTPTPDNTAVIGAGPDTATTNERTDSIVRNDAEHVTLAFKSGAFQANSTVAIANIDTGATAAYSAEADGSLHATVEARSGATLFLATVVDTVASAPYVVTAP